MQIYSTGCSPSDSLTFSTAYASLSWDSYLEIGGQKISLRFGKMRKCADGTALRRADFSGGYTEEHICFLKDSRFSNEPLSFPIPRRSRSQSITPRIRPFRWTVSCCCLLPTLP